MASNEQQIEYWNGRAGQRWAAQQERIDWNLAEITEAVIPFARAKPGEHILDIGCGCGTATLMLARAVRPNGSVAGVDISAPMLAVARARAHSGQADIPFIEADASAYDFQPTFDLVFSRFGVMFFADPFAAFANIHKAVAPKGRLAFVCWRSTDGYLIVRRLPRRRAHEIRRRNEHGRYGGRSCQRSAQHRSARSRRSRTRRRGAREDSGRRRNRDAEIRDAPRHRPGRSVLVGEREGVKAGVNSGAENCLFNKLTARAREPVHADEDQAAAEGERAFRKQNRLE